MLFLSFSPRKVARAHGEVPEHGDRGFQGVAIQRGPWLHRPHGAVCAAGCSTGGKILTWHLAVPSKRKLIRLRRVTEAALSSSLGSQGAGCIHVSLWRGSKGEEFRKDIVGF